MKRQSSLNPETTSAALTPPQTPLKVCIADSAIVLLPLYKTCKFASGLQLSLKHNLHFWLIHFDQDH